MLARTLMDAAQGFTMSVEVTSYAVRLTRTSALTPGLLRLSVDAVSRAVVPQLRRTAFQLRLVTQYPLAVG